MNENDRESGDAGVQAPMTDGRRGEGSPMWVAIPVVEPDDIDGAMMSVVMRVWIKADGVGHAFIYADEVSGVAPVDVCDAVARLCRTGLMSAIAYDGGFICHLATEGCLLPPSSVQASPSQFEPSTIDLSDSRLRGGVYVMRTGWGPSTAIKIGISSNIESRLKQAGTFSPHGVCLLYRIPGGERDERALHQLLAPYRLRGEWFRWDMKVRALIESFIATRVRS